jgi:hypothetical protein
MASNTIHCEVIVQNLIEPTSIQLDEEHNVLFVLTTYYLTRIDLNEKSNNVEFVYEHNRKFRGIKVDDDNYSQGESDDDIYNFLHDFLEYFFHYIGIEKLHKS